MKKIQRCESGSASAPKLVLIITGSIIAAAGILLLIMKLCKKKHACKLHDFCCHDDSDSIDSWDIDEDALSELELDDEDETCEACGCDDSCDCGETCECGDSSECDEDKPADAQ